MADYTNHVGGIPVNNFTLGAQVNDTEETFTMGGTYVTELNNSRGGNHTHACMPGCVIQCSNVYHDAQGKEMTSPVEYETLAILGTNCGLRDPDHLAEMNQYCNELGIDTIETGATIAVMMDAGWLLLATWLLCAMFSRSCVMAQPKGGCGPTARLLWGNIMGCIAFPLSKSRPSVPTIRALSK